MTLFEFFGEFERRGKSLSTAAQALLFNIVVKVNKNFWKPTKISPSEMMLPIKKAHLYRIIHELVENNFLEYSKGIYTLKIDEASHIVDKESHTGEKNSHIGDKKSRI